MEKLRTLKPLALAALLVGCAALSGFASAQLKQQDPDPLARMRAAAAAQSQACTVKEPTACSEAVPKIVASALASAQLAENQRRLNDAAESSASWAVTAFHDIGVDEVHSEPIGAASQGEANSANIVAEIRGRERPQEFVLLGAHLPDASGNRIAGACNAALLMEAVRDIHLTGLRPRRSIRFALFAGPDRRGSEAYVQAHSRELDGAIAAIILGEGGCEPVTGFSLGGRRDTEPGVRESFSVAPIDNWNVSRDSYDAPWGADNFDFLLQGVPTLLTNRADAAAADNSNLDSLKHDAAIVGVLAFSLAEHVAPLGPRLSRAQIAEMLAKSGWDTEMKSAGLWQDWESGRRGRKQ